MNTNVVPQEPQISPEAKAIANFLRQHKLLKQRQGIFNGKRHDFFRVKRALRALESDGYKKAQSKPNSNLPLVNSHQKAIEVFAKMPINRMALRVSKLTTSEAREKSLKPQRDAPCLELITHQEFGPDMYYVWLYEKVNPMSYVYGALVILGIFSVVLFPLWPVFMRKGVWYLSVAVMGLIGLIIFIAILRLILFAITVVVLPQGFWLFPNLFADVGFFESFVPLYGWQGDEEKKTKKKSKKSVTITSEKEG